MFSIDSISMNPNNSWLQQASTQSTFQSMMVPWNQPVEDTEPVLCQELTQPTTQNMLQMKPPSELVLLTQITNHVQSLEVEIQKLNFQMKET